MDGIQKEPFFYDDEILMDAVTDTIKAGRAALARQTMQYNQMDALVDIIRNQQILIDELSDTVEFQRKMLKND
jgi:hypothetical protein